MVKRLKSVSGPAGQSIGRWLTKASVDGRKKVVIEEIHQKESMAEAGQLTIDKGSRVSF
jgi:hypothetical protein